MIKLSAILSKDLDLPGSCLYQSLQISYPTQDLSGSPRGIDPALVGCIDSKTAEEAYL